MPNLKNKKPKEKKSINPFVLLFSVLVVMSIFSYIIPAGEYTRTLVDGRNVVVPNSFKTISRTPVSFFDIFSSVHYNWLYDICYEFYCCTICITCYYHKKTCQKKTIIYFSFSSSIFIRRNFNWNG